MISTVAYERHSTCRGFNAKSDTPQFADIPNEPNRTKELQRQIQVLLDKCFIRESFSPCLVPSPLTSKKDGTWRMCLDDMLRRVIWCTNIF